ncbi:MAG: hypothetical protein ACRCUG_04035 [Yersinia sp. (in: enterobacteria)]
MEPTNVIHSKIFGKSNIPTDFEQAQIEQLVKDCPVAVINKINILLNNRGIKILLYKLPINPITTH